MQGKSGLLFLLCRIRKLLDSYGTFSRLKVGQGYKW